jgi:nucleotide sugar dehydrogenase
MEGLQGTLSMTNPTVRQGSEKIENKKTSVCVIGVGFVGLNLVEIFANDKRFNVCGYDILPERVSYLQQNNAKENVTFQSTVQGLENTDLFIIAVSNGRNSVKDELDLQNIINIKLVLEKIAKIGSTIIIESTMYVGGTRELFGNFVDRNIQVGYSPERLDSCRKTPSFKEIPKIISGLTNKSLENIREYYSPIFDTCISVSSVETAEMCKLYENCFRVVNIAYTNEIADMCRDLRINTNEMISACNTKPYGFMSFYPGLGIGGKCLPHNPYYLMKDQKYSLPILQQSSSFLELRPYVKACDILKNQEFKRVLILGLGFKTGESEIFNSPSVCFAYSLIKCNRFVKCYDPTVQKTVLPKFANFIDFIHLDNYNVNYINENFDTVIITIKQTDIDYTILNTLKPEIKITSFV